MILMRLLVLSIEERGGPFRWNGPRTAAQGLP